jgi:ribonuclease HI
VPPSVPTLNPDSGIALFTDGSSSPKRRTGGWAWVAIDAYDALASAAGSASDTTNNRMEMEAWIRGLEWLHENCGSCKVLVYSDSEYVGLGAMDRSRKRNNNVDLWIGIDEAIRLHDSVEFIHVYGHKDSYYNCMVDEMAVEARYIGERLNEQT